ncbi:MAG: tripartite tricarboxylate transporter substrate binding protein [Pigmentiphaga sp.]
MNRKSIVSALVMMSLAPLALAADFPDKPVRVMVNMPAGGPLDIMARALSEKVSQYLGQPFVIENRGGSGGNIGAAAVAQAAPDGYTWLMSLDSTFAINPHLYRSMGFELDRVRPVAVLARNGILLVTNAKQGITSLDALMQASEKGPINFGTPGNGTPAHLTVALLNQHVKLNYNHIPYRGNAPATMAVVSGEVGAAVSATPGVLQHVKSGALNALAVMGKTRSDLLPDVPTMAELKHPEVDFEVKYVLAAPAGMDAARQQVIVDAFVRAMGEPDIQERLKTMDVQAVIQTGNAVTETIQQLSEQNRKLIEASGMQVD